MKGWRWLLLVSLVVGSIILEGCSQGISQAEYDKVKSDLSSAQTQIQKLEVDLNTASEQTKQAQATYDALETQLAQSGTDLEKLQNMTTQAAPYLRILDLSLDQQRSEIGIKPRYWQYTESYVQDEIEKAVVDSKDATLKSLWDIYKQNPQNESRWFSYTMAALTSTLSGQGVPVAVLPAAPVISISSNGQTVLRVKMLQIDGTPVPNLEVDLWASNSPPGPPNAGVVTTNSSGIATFTVNAGDYYIGFNSSNFPAAYVYSNGRGVTLQTGMTTDIEIRLFKKEG